MRDEEKTFFRRAKAFKGYTGEGHSHTQAQLVYSVVIVAGPKHLVRRDSAL